MRLLDLFRERELFRVNDLVAERTHAVGAIVEKDGVRYRVTRHKVYPTIPWSTYVVYGVEE